MPLTPLTRLSQVEGYKENDWVAGGDQRSPESRRSGARIQRAATAILGTLESGAGRRRREALTLSPMETVAPRFRVTIGTVSGPEARINVARLRSVRSIPDILGLIASIGYDGKPSPVNVRDLEIPHLESAHVIRSARTKRAGYGVNRHALGHRGVTSCLMCRLRNATKVARGNLSVGLAAVNNPHGRP